MTQLSLRAIGERINKQNNRATSQPMFCVQEKIRDMGYDASFCSETCWYNQTTEETRYTEPPADEVDDWDEFGYKDRWETVMVAFTEKGCKEYLEQNGHNHDETRIYVKSFDRCPEMVAIREQLILESQDFV